MSRRTLILIGGLVLVAGVAAGVIARRGPSRLAVDVAAAGRKARFRSTVTASGEIVATRYADIGSSVMGKIVSLPVAEGDRVKAGQILARIDPVQAESDLASATEQARALDADAQAASEAVKAADADVAAADARQRDAEQKLKRASELAKEGLAPASDLDAASLVDRIRSAESDARTGTVGDTAYQTFSTNVRASSTYVAAIFPRLVARLAATTSATTFKVSAISYRFCRHW